MPKDAGRAVFDLGVVHRLVFQVLPIAGRIGEVF
jgi:hypothetical protein